LSFEIAAAAGTNEFYHVRVLFAFGPASYPTALRISSLKIRKMIFL